MKRKLFMFLGIVSCTMFYDPTVFTLEDPEGADQFVYQTEEKLEGQVYMTVLAYADMDAETIQFLPDREAYL